MIIVEKDEKCPTEAHWHLDPLFWQVHQSKGPVMLVSVSYHEPERGIFENVSSIIQPPQISFTPKVPSSSVDSLQRMWNTSPVSNKDGSEGSKPE